MVKRWLRICLVVAVGVAVVGVGLAVLAAAKPDEKVERLTGAFALRHVAEKEIKRPEFRAMRQKFADELRAKGATPTGEIVVLRREFVKKTGTLARLVEAVVPALHAQEVWYGGGEEVIMESWSSGVSSQWLGNAYHENLSDGWWMAGNTLVDFGPTIADPNQDAYVSWVGAVERDPRDPPTRADATPRGSLEKLAEFFLPTVCAQAGPACNAGQRQIFRSFIQAGFNRMRADNTYNWWGSVFAGAAAGPAGFAIGALSFFGASCATGYTDAMWNFTQRCPGWYWQGA